MVALMRRDAEDLRVPITARDRLLRECWAMAEQTHGAARLSQYPTAQQVAARLAEACGHPSHAFWPQQVPGASAIHLWVIAADAVAAG